MGKRSWLNDAIANEYLPFLSSLSDDEAGRAEAQEFNQTIRDSWAQRGLSTVAQQQSLMDTTRRSLKDHLGENHFCLDYIKFSTEEYIELNNLKQGRVELKNEQIQFLDDPDAIVGKASALLDSPEWSEIAAALSVLTGRRSSEILSTARFSPCSYWSVTFTGALKRGGETQVLSFEIPTLAPAALVCQALDRVRKQLPDAANLTPEQVKSRFGAAVIAQCDRHFHELVPCREGKDNLYTHLFRAVYATIATFWFCPPRVNDVEFKAAIQGHYAILDEENSERRRSLTASRHYSDYEIADSVIARYNGRRKGVRLGEEGVRVISPFRERSSEQPKTHRKKHLGTVRIWRDDKPLLDSLFERLGLDTTLNQSEKMAQLLLWVDEKLADSPQPLQGELDLSPIPSEDQAISSPDPQAAVSEAAPKAIASTVQVFVQPDDEPDPEPPDKIPSPPVEEAPPSSGLEEKLEKLIDVMAQFLSFQMAQSAPNPSPPKKSPPPKDAPAPPSEAAIKEAAIANKEAAVSESAPTAIANDDKPSRSPRHSPEAEAAINNAIDALIAHNNKTELHDLKWFISINSVKELVSHLTKSQRLVQKVMVSRQQEIDSHHSQHQLEPNHNHRHKQKRRVGDVIFL
jgi:hypothetical protein